MSNTLFVNFLTELKNQIDTWYEIKCRELLSHIILLPGYIFKGNYVFTGKEDNSLDKTVELRKN